MKPALALAAVVALGGCYHPAGLDGPCALACGPAGACPASHRCLAGFCVLPGEVCVPGDAATIGDGDAPGLDDAAVTTPSCTPGNYTGNPMPKAGIVTAYSAHLTQMVWVSTPLDKIEAFGPTTGTAFFSSTFTDPRIGPDGLEIFMLDSTPAMVRMVWQGSWSVPAPVTVVPAISFIPGTVSATSPYRHMVVSVPASAALYEGVEASVGGKWTFTPQPTNGFTEVIEPSLSEDGLRVVFVGKESAGMAGIYATQRPTVASTFTTATKIFDLSAVFSNPIDAHAPFLPSDDCSTLFFSVSGIEYSAQ